MEEALNWILLNYDENSIVSSWPLNMVRTIAEVAALYAAYKVGLEQAKWSINNARNPQTEGTPKVTP